MIKTEKQLLNFIKYSPIILILFFAIVINIVIFMQNEENYKTDLENYKTNFISTHKEIVKAQVTKTYNDIISERKKTEKHLKENLRERVLEAYSIVNSIYKQHKGQNKDYTIRIIKEALRDIRFNDGRGYFYIFDANAVNILHPIKPHLEGTSLIEFKDSRDKYIFKSLVREQKLTDELYSNIYWTKPGDDSKEFKKINFTKKFEPLNLIIGTGEYLDDFTKELKEHILKDHIQKNIYRKNGYVFIVDYEGKYLAHIKKDYIGLNRLQLTDKNGFKITKEIVKTAKEGSGFVNYIGTIMPETGKPAKKTTYVKGLDDWQWSIASGFYEKEMLSYLQEKEKKLKLMQEEYLTKTILISLVITLFLIVIVSLISKYLQKAFKEYNDRILNEVNENRRKDLLLYQQSKMASMGEMIGNIAHQWRQPLNLISTAASRIQIEQEFETLTKEKQDESLEAILKSTKHLSQTIDDFREFFNPNKVVTTFSTSDLYQKTLQLVSSRYKNTGIDIIETIEDVELMTYENELLQSIINIFNNAIDALAEKDQAKKYIFFETYYYNNCNDTTCKIDNCKQRDNGAFTLLKIRDNAGGIKEDKLDKIFEAYYTTKHQSQGTGIGLYMTYEIITKHLEGYVNVSNVEYSYDGENHKGAEFTICLPANKKM